MSPAHTTVPYNLDRLIGTYGNVASAHYLIDRRHIIGHSDYAPKRRRDPGVVFDWSRIGLPAAMPKS